jgi:hypothetical protein
VAESIIIQNSHLRKMGDVGRNPVAEMATSYCQSRHARSHSSRKPFGDGKAPFKFESRQAEVKTPSRTICHGPRNGSRGREHVISNKHVHSHPVTSDCLAFAPHVPCCNLVLLSLSFMSAAAGCDILAQESGRSVHPND